MLDHRIVVLDGHAMNPGDLSWRPLEALAPTTIHERTEAGDLPARLAHASVALTNKCALSADLLAVLPGLRFISVTATGTNIVDVEAAQRLGIVVSNVPHYAADSVAEHVLGFMLQSSKHLAEHFAAVRAGQWSAQPDFSLQVAPISLLAGKTLGIVGFGAIGQRVAQLGVALRMDVVAVERRGHPSVTLLEGLRRAPLEHVLEESDFLSLHCPLTSETHHLMNAERLALLKEGAVLINTARGGLVDEAALAEALRGGRLRAAYLDVLSSEPPGASHPLLSLPNCWVTPHVAWASRQARERLLKVSVDNVRAFLAGHPQNVVRH